MGYTEPSPQHHSPPPRLVAHGDIYDTDEWRAWRRDWSRIFNGIAAVFGGIGVAIFGLSVGGGYAVFAISLIVPIVDAIF